MDYPGTVIERGSTGDAVIAIQKALGVQSTGTFGPTTEAEIKKFQASHGIGQTGRVGPQTWDVLFPSTVITAAQFKQIVPQIHADRIALYLPFLNEAMLEFAITTPARCAAFLGQTAHESDGYATLREYATGKEYEGRADLGNTHSGDGVRFAGRGPIQVTGRYNYQAVSQALGFDFLTHPEQLEQPVYAFRGSAWWWNDHGLNALSDLNTEDAYRKITQIINGGHKGIESRLAYWNRAKAAFGA